MNKIINIKNAIPLEDYKLFVTFDDGITKTVDILPMIKNGVSSALKNKEYFDAVQVENGYITWKNGFDICPVFLRKL